MFRADPAATDARRSTWLEVVLATVALVVALTSFRHVVGDSVWFVTTCLVMAAVTAAVLVMRLIGAGRWATPVASVAGFLVVAWVFVPQTLVVVLPTADTFAALGDLGRRAGATIVDEQAPVAAAEPVVFVVAASFGVLVLVADLVLRSRAAVPLLGVLLLAVFLTPSVIVGRGASAWTFLLVAAAWLTVLRLRTVGDGERSSHHLPAVAMGLTGLLGALVFPSVAPDVRAVAASWGNAPPQVFGRGINPMVELGSNLRRNRPVTVLSYTTDLDEPPYLKVATLADFTGDTWAPEGEDDQYARFESRLRIDPEVEVEEKTTDIVIESLRSEYLPVPYPATQIDGYEGRLRWVRTGQTIEAVRGDSVGQDYQVTSLELKPTADQLRASDPEVPVDMLRFTSLVYPPDSQAAVDVIERTVDDVLAEADGTTNYDRVVALESYLRSSEFTYSEDAPVRDDYDGNGIDVLGEFLQEKAGYCVHFSSALAVMARSLDIPARIAVGYTPGSRSGLTGGEQNFRVRSDNLHAWTEVYFEGVGWVQFDPTPGVGRASDFEEDIVAGDSPDDPAAPDTPEDRGESPNAVEGDTATGAEAESGTVTRSVLAVLAAIALVLAVPAGVRAMRRWWRLRDDRGVGPVWREVIDTARDLGVATSTTLTPRVFAERLRRRAGVDDAALDEVLTAVELERYSRQGRAGGDPAAAARRLTASLLAAAPRRARWRARLLPRSLSRVSDY